MGAWHAPPPPTRVALLASMGVDPAAQRAPPAAPVPGVRPQHVTPLRGPAALTREEGTVLRVEAALPPDLPFGFTGSKC